MKLGNAEKVSAVLGVCDATTGLLLLFAPSFVFSMLGFSRLPLENVSLQFIGIFVFATGLYYWIPFLFGDNSQRAADLKLIWIITSVVRSLVATFIITQVALGVLTEEWLTVALFDGLTAGFQLTILRRGINSER